MVQFIDQFRLKKVAAGLSKIKLFADGAKISLQQQSTTKINPEDMPAPEKTNYQSLLRALSVKKNVVTNQALVAAKLEKSKTKSKK